MTQLVSGMPDGGEVASSSESVGFTQRQHPQNQPEPSSQAEHQSKLQPELSQPFYRGRLMIFIDGANLFYAASQMGIEVDYANLLRHFQKNSTLIYAFFYTGVDPNNPRQQAFLTWMRRNGYRVITRDVILKAAGVKRVGSMNVEIAVDMVRFALDCDTEVLISGDGDLSYAIEIVGQMGTRVELYSLRSMTHEGLMMIVDRYTDLSGIREDIQKPPKP